MASEMLKEFVRGLRPGKKAVPQSLTTPWSEQPELPWDAYPRPQLRRSSFFCLNGWWDFSCGDFSGQIRVPYPMESRLSGVGRTHRTGEILHYFRTFTLPEGFRRDRVLLHFGAADQLCRVFLNDRELGSHEGGYLPFSFDVTDALTAGENRLRLEIRDDLDHDLPWGKQRENRGGMWYTPVSGIWQTVWMESVPEGYIEALRITADDTRVTVEITGGSDEMYLRCDGKRYALRGNALTFCPEHPKLWSPDFPHLYHFSVESGEDRVESYFALRKVEVRREGDFFRTYLNGRPIFFHGLLDQGYYADGLYLPGSPEGYTFDLQTAKALGFNTLRKHIKIEPEQFYYDCDRLGLLVFQDMVNSGDYFYLRDTALPTLGQKKIMLHPRPNPRRQAFFEEHVRQTLEHLHNHPCVVLYTLFNEGWGQYDSGRLYDQAKHWAPDRLWNTASGWFACGESDVQSEHWYFGGLKLRNRGKKPLLLTEFGGYSWPVEGHRFNREREYGYRKFTDQTSFQMALEQLYRTQILPRIRENGLCGAILTQLSDVEDETNGLVTYDRQLCKADPAAMRRLARDLDAEAQ